MADDNMTTGAPPYRDAPSDVRYLCTVCYRVGSAVPGTCPRCNAPLLSLDDGEVVSMVRARVGAGLARKRAWLSAAGVVVGFGLAAAICVALRLPLFDLDLKFGQYGSWLVSIGLPLSVGWWFLTWRMFRAPTESEPIERLLSRLPLERLQ